MIYLNAEVLTSDNEDTFWDWAKRIFPESSYEIPSYLGKNDVVLRYSTLGYLPIPGKSVALCWEMYPKMQETYLNTSQYAGIVEKVNETARYCTYRTVASPKNVQYYEKYGKTEVIPIGVDTDFWKPMNAKESLKRKYGIPSNKKVGIWIGTLHHMKGFSQLLEYASRNKDIYWIIVLGRNYKSINYFDNGKIFFDIPQSTIVELINASDFYLCTNRLSAYYMADWEAMACNIPFVYESEVEPEFVVSENPRGDLMERGWNREAVQRRWEEFFERHDIKYK